LRGGFDSILKVLGLNRDFRNGRRGLGIRVGGGGLLVYMCRVLEGSCKSYWFVVDY
jgi:hypothetical protein